MVGGKGCGRTPIIIIIILRGLSKVIIQREKAL